MEPNDLMMPDDRDPWEASTQTERSEYEDWSAELDRKNAQIEKQRRYDDWLDSTVCPGCQQRMRSCFCNDYQSGNSDSSFWRSE